MDLVTCTKRAPSSGREVGGEKFERSTNYVEQDDLENSELSHFSA